VHFARSQAAGLFETPFVDISASIGKFDTAEDRELARRVAVEGAILLKNGQRGKQPPPLPLRLTASSTVAIIGPVADDAAAHNGNYAFSSAHISTVLEAAAAAVPAGAKVIHAMGCNATGNWTAGFNEAVAAAVAADVVVAVVGDSGDHGWATATCGEDDDRMQLDLPGMQPELLTAVRAKIGSTKPLVVVLVHGRPVTFVRHNLLSSLDAVLSMWRPGEEGGPAAWKLLLGEQSPSGRLAQAWPRSAGQVHSSASPWFHKRTGGFDRESWRGGPSQQNAKSQNYSAAPLFDFQFGLSYTDFNISATHTTALDVGVAGAVNVSVAVGNTGHVAAKAVVAVYFSKPLSNRVRYHKMLAAFAKTDTIPAHLTAEVEIEVLIAKLSSYDPALKQQSVEPGSYDLQAVCDHSVGPTIRISVSSGNDDNDRSSAPVLTAAKQQTSGTHCCAGSLVGKGTGSFLPPVSSHAVRCPLVLIPTHTDSSCDCDWLDHRICTAAVGTLTCTMMATFLSLCMLSVQL
jgi:beta-glucosidase